MNLSFFCEVTTREICYIAIDYIQILIKIK